MNVSGGGSGSNGSVSSFMDSNKNDDEVSDVLREWGFDDLVPIFTRNEIDIKTFQNLKERDLSLFLPYKKVLDFFPVFEENVANLKRKRVDSDAEILPDLSPSTSQVTLTSSVTETLAQITASVQDQEALVSKSKPSVDLAFLDDDNEDGHVDDRLVSDLKKLFEQTFGGQILLLTPSEDRTDLDRNQIASIIVCDELRRGVTKTISSERLLQLAKAAAVLFQGEDYTTFYTPYRKIKNKVFQANGKFCTQLYAWRQKGINVGLISQGQPFKKFKLDAPISDVPEDITKSIDWLRVNLGPPGIALVHWKASFEYRDRYLVATSDLCAIEVYFNTFPILRQPKDGLELLLQDYMLSEKLKATSDNFATYWPEFSERFLKKLTSKIIPQEELTALQLLCEKEKGVNVCHHLLLHFSRIFPTPVVVKEKKPKHWTATKAEIQLAFLGHYHSEEEFRTSIVDRVTKYASFKKPLRFQPFAAIVGPNVRRVQKCYVVLQPNDTYEVDSPYEAVDYTFKAIQVLDAHYPAESKLLWLTLQQGLYKLFTEHDCEISSSALVPILKYFNKA